MLSPRFPFRIHLADTDAVVTMDCGEGVYRARTMPIPFLRTLAEFCRRCELILELLRHDDGFGRCIAVFPNCTPLAEFPFGPCTARVTAARERTRATEFAIALYDADDMNSPVLLLAEEQIQDFVGQVDGLLQPPEGKS